MRTLTLILLLTSLSAWAADPTPSKKIISEDLTVRALSLDQPKSRYKLIFMEKAAFYWAEKALIGCLEDSLKSQKPAKIEYDPRSLQVISCKK